MPMAWVASLAAMILLVGCPSSIVRAPTSLGTPSILVTPDVVLTGQVESVEKARSGGLDRTVVDQISAALSDAGYGVLRAAGRPHDLVAHVSAEIKGNFYLAGLTLVLEDPTTGVQVLTVQEDARTGVRNNCVDLVNKMSESRALSAWATQRKNASRPVSAAAAGAAPADASSPTRPELPEGGKVAVLDFRSFTKRVNADNASYFGDVVRGSCLGTAPRLEVMTRENLLVLLQASGKDLSNCEGECEVDTGRRIGADLVVSGDIHELGSLLKLALRLHETKSGRLLMATQASGKSIEDLDYSAQQAAKALFLPLR